MNNTKLCLYCYKYFNDDNELEEHLKICNNNKKRIFIKKIKKNKCMYCGIVCNSRDGLNKHYAKCYKKKETEIVTATDSKILTQHLNTYNNDITNIKFGDIMRLTAYIPNDTNKK